MNIEERKSIDGVLSKGNAPFKKCAVIVAGGIGSRAGGGVPKQFRMLKDRPVAWWAIEAFRREDPLTRIILVVHPSYISYWHELMVALPENERPECELVAGGASRVESVRNALRCISADKDSLIAVHDAARPLISTEMLVRGWNKAQECGACVPVIPVTDSLRHLLPEGSESVVRKDFVAVQTPQIFAADILKKAYRIEDSENFTDDASIVEAMGIGIELYEGDPRNIKITNTGDFAVADLYLDEIRNA